jgi:DNA-directed RNA polymerase subunit K/omega
MNKFEKALVIGARTRQIENGAKPNIDPTKYGLVDSDHIAEKEYEFIPVYVVRTFPNGTATKHKV